MGEAYIFDAVRTPRGKGKQSGALYTVRPVDLVVTALRALQERYQLDTSEVEDVVMGCVTQTGEQGSCIARAAALEAGFHQIAAGVTLNRFCGSGMEAVHYAAGQIAAGFADLVVAGGVESMSRVPMGSDGGAMWDAVNQWRVGTVPQGVAADLLATLRGFSRGDVDHFALTSQQRAVEAIEAGRFRRSVVPVRDQNGEVILDRDEFPRPDATLEGLSALRPAFKMMGEQFGLDTITKRKYPQLDRINHIHTAGNSSGIVDGAAAVLLATKEKGEALGLKPRARIRSAAVVGDEPILMLDGPIPATKKALKKARMEIQDIDLIEVNEAFAAVPLAFMQAFGVSHDIVNVNGGAIALGHPLGATGAMLLGTVLDALEDRDLSTGLITACIAGGMGIATIVERV
ncbi:MAG: acetyl-CoA C-acetyltransferase [Myxococcales bacterium]|nr:acetyl-CoA C-acetyltransferase [Myxococcales bacterium]MCB9642775.1 acetyl-CoA C-acetyltransferase [Myxococcales bacterium]